MKNVRKFFLLSGIAIAMTFVFISCNDDDNDPNDPVLAPATITDVAIASPDLSSLVAALNEAELANTLAGDGPFTVFAPTNDAFASFLTDNGFTSVEDVPDAVLEQVLLNHVVSGQLPAAALTTSYVSSLSTAGPDDRALSLYVDVSSGVEINGVTVITADIPASNGVIHVVDEVIDLPTVADHAVINPGLSELVGALTAEGQPDFVATLSTPAGTDPAPFTVFAPIDSAFQALGDAAPEGDALTAVLNHHVIAGANIVSGDLSDGLVSPATLEGDALTFSADNDTFSITDGLGNSGVGIVVANIQAVNGVVHAIDAVLLPDTENDTEEED